jgi:hypothetical protein
MKKLIDNYRRTYQLIDPISGMSHFICEEDILIQGEEGAELEVIYTIRELYLDEVMSMRIGEQKLIYTDRSESLQSVEKIVRVR